MTTTSWVESVPDIKTTITKESITLVCFSAHNSFDRNVCRFIYKCVT